MSKKIVSLLLALVLVLCSVSALADTFEGEAEGFKPLKVSVTVNDGKIEAIDMLVNDETPSIGGAAIETLTKAIIDGQTMAVDTISGATYTTAGFTSAVANALIEAGLDPIAMGYVDKSVVELPACMRLELRKNKSDIYYYFTWKNNNVCSAYTDFMLYYPEGATEMLVYDARVYGGCQGTADAVGALCTGLTVDECIARLSGVQCSGSATGVDSCPDQLAQALAAGKAYLEGTLCDGCDAE